MATSPSSPTPPVGLTEAEAAVRLLGSDPWMRFDLWSSRAWDATEKAVQVAAANGPPMSSDDGLDPRIVCLFHAAEVAKEFAELVNPLNAVTDEDYIGLAGLASPELSVSIIANPDDLD
jgi:hypothetical protein